MKIARFLIITLAASLTMFILAGIWHELVMAAFYSTETHATHGGTVIIFLAYLALGVLMVYFYTHIPKEKRSWLSDLKFGMLMGLLWVFPHELAMAGAHDTSIVYVLKNGLWHMIEQGAGGIVIGIVYWKMQKR